MEEKALKTSVYVNDTLYSDLVEVPIDIDFTLPDYCSDISKIFKCKACPRISSKGVNGKNITVDGAVSITVIYCDKEGRLVSYEYQYPFSKNLEMQKDGTGANLCCTIRTDYINCRAVTGRKVDIHGAAGMNVRVFKRVCNNIISDYNDDNIELRRGTAPATVPMGFAEKYIMLEEEIRIGQSQPAIKSILRYSANPCVKETKVIKDKAVVKGEMAVSVLYCPENGGVPQCVKATLPFSQIIDVSGIGEECMCDTKAETAFLEIKPRTSVSGENKSFTLTAKLLLTCEAYCGNDIAILLDAFSRKFQAEIIKNKVCFENITSNISEVYHCKKNIELEENISSVIDLWCDLQSAVTKFEEGNMIICGTLIASLIVCNESGNATYHEKPIDFEYKYPVNCETGTPHCDPQIEILSCGYTITSLDNVEVQIELGINAAIYECSQMPLISDISVDETKTVLRKSNAALTVYFTAENESVWDIARNYNSSVNEIMSINNLENDILPEGKTILIPMR